MGSPSPAFSESELREHLDLLSTVVTSVSDRLDTQATTLNTLVEAAASARQAAFAARAQTDPQAYGAEVVKTVQASLAEVSQRFDKLAAIHADLQAERLAATQWRRRVPGIYGTAARRRTVRNRLRPRAGKMDHKHRHWRGQMRPPQNPLLTDAGFGANTPSTPNGERAAITTDQAWRALLARNITVIDIIAALNGAIAKGKVQI